MRQLYPESRPACRHCKAKPTNRPRGLCWTCWRAPGVKELYPPTSRYANRGVADRTSSHDVLPVEATDAEPGSEEKVRVLCERAARGEALHHPGDARVTSASVGHSGIYVIAGGGYSLSLNPWECGRRDSVRVCRAG